MSNVSFLDVGARRGLTSQLLLARESNPDLRSYMFEPNPILVKELREKFEEEPRAIIYEAAFTNFDGHSHLYWDESTGEGASLYASKKTSIGAPAIMVECIDVRHFIRSIPEGKIILYSNCEGSEFEIIETLFDTGLWKKISMWSIAFHHGDRKIPSMKPAYFRLKEKMDELGIENVPGHFGKEGIRDGMLDEFIEKVRCLISE